MLQFKTENITEWNKIMWYIFQKPYLYWEIYLASGEERLLQNLSSSAENMS